MNGNRPPDADGPEPHSLRDRMSGIADRRGERRDEPMRADAGATAEPPRPDSRSTVARGGAATVAPGSGTDVTDDRHFMTDDDIKVITGGEDLGIYRAHRRYGGLDVGAAIAGLLAAVGLTALLGSLAGGVGTVGYQMDVSDTETLSAGGFITGLVVLLASFVFGGWVAGRVSRYDGGRNGLLTAGLFVVLSAILAGLGAWLGNEYNVFGDIQAPQWFSSNATTATAILSAIIGVAVVFGAAFLGGKLGERYHRKADKYLAEYAEGRGKQSGTMTTRGLDRETKHSRFGRKAKAQA